MGMPHAGHWQKARLIESSDTLITDYKYTNFDATKAIKVAPYPAILIRCFIQDANNEDATLALTGWMNAGETLNPDTGPGLELLYVLATGGNQVCADIPMLDTGAGASNWYEVDTYNAGSKWNPSRAFVFQGVTAADVTTPVLVPTLGCTHVMFEGVLGTGTTALGILWHPMAAEQLFPFVKTMTAIT